MNAICSIQHLACDKCDTCPLDIVILPLVLFRFILLCPPYSNVTRSIDSNSLRDPLYTATTPSPSAVSEAIRIDLELLCSPAAITSRPPNARPRTLP